MPMSIRDEEAYVNAFVANFAQLSLTDLEVHHYPHGVGQQKFYKLHELLTQAQSQVERLHTWMQDYTATKHEALFDEELYTSVLHRVLNYCFALMHSFIFWAKSKPYLHDLFVTTSSADKGADVEQQIKSAYAIVEKIEWLLVAHLEDLLLRSRDLDIDSESQVQQLSFWQRHAERFAEIDRILCVLPASPMRHYYELARWKNYINALEKHQEEILSEYAHLLHKFSNPALYTDEAQMIAQIKACYARYMLEATSFSETLRQAKEWYSDLSCRPVQYDACFKMQQRFYEIKAEVKLLTEETKISYDPDGKVYEALVKPLKGRLRELAMQGYVPACYELSKLGCGLDGCTEEEDAYLEQAVHAKYPLASIDFCEKVIQTREEQDQRARNKSLDQAVLQTVFDLAQVHGNAAAYGAVQAIIAQGSKVTEQLTAAGIDIRDVVGSHGVVMRHILEVCSYLPQEHVWQKIIPDQFPAIFEIDLTDEVASPTSIGRGKCSFFSSCGLESGNSDFDQKVDSLPRLVY